MLNIAAGGHFYERAKSRRQRHREVFATGAGMAVTKEAVPLGLKRKKSGEGMKEALARLKAGKSGVAKDLDGNTRRTSIVAEKNKTDAHSGTASTNKRSKEVEDAGMSKDTKKTKRAQHDIPSGSSGTRDATTSDDVIDLTDE